MNEKEHPTDWPPKDGLIKRVSRGTFFENELSSNSNNIPCNFREKETLIKAINDAIKAGRVEGYVVIYGFSASNEIAEKLQLDKNLSLVVPRPHLVQIGKRHRIDGELVFEALRVASMKPKYILFDNGKGNYRFVVEAKEKQHRLVIDFGVIPNFAPGMKANVLESVFRDSKRYENYIRKLKSDPNSEIAFVYGTEDGWTSSVYLSLILRRENLIHHARDSRAGVLTDTASTHNVPQNK